MYTVAIGEMAGVTPRTLHYYDESTCAWKTGENGRYYGGIDRCGSCCRGRFSL